MTGKEAHLGPSSLTIFFSRRKSGDTALLYCLKIAMVICLQFDDLTSFCIFLKLFTHREFHSEVVK